VTEACDALVVGAGHNGLATGVMLAEAGWDVIVVERNDEPGGAVRTAEVTEPGFKHDLYATNLNLFAGSAFHAEFGERLRDHGLAFAHSSRPFSSIFPDGASVGVSTDMAETIDSIGRISKADAEAWKRLAERFDRIAPHIFSILGAPLPSAAAARAVWHGQRALGRDWPLELARLAFQSTREFTEEQFESRELQALCATWGMHIDFPPDVPGGAMFPFLESFSSAANGQVIGAGGARTMVDSLVSLLSSLGARLVTGSPVERITVADGRAVGARLADGRQFHASRAVVSNVGPRPLFGELVPAEALPASFRRKVPRYRHAPGTLMIHLAMDDLPPWPAQDLGTFGYVHVAGYLEDMTLAYSQAAAGLLPAAPTIVVGQPTVADPTRAPQGKHVLWLMVRFVPGTIRGDAAGEIEATDWDEAKEPYADRILDILESYAPGISTLVRKRHVLSPPDLEADNPNLVGGDLSGGTHHPMQFFFLRPFPGWSRYRTPIDRLYVCGASTWPGAGVGAASGYILGKQLLSGSGLRARISSRRRS
jgi:phytoene dehydrogenase-like protein